MFFCILTEAEAIRFGAHYEHSIMLFLYDRPIDTHKDELAFGFMTWYPNGTLVRIDSQASTDYIDIRMVSLNSILI